MTSLLQDRKPMTTKKHQQTKPTTTTTTKTTHNIPVTHLPQVQKGKSDWRTYRPLQLPNGVTCVLVHDKESKLTAMATVVDAGASSDPRSLSGLAHFTEHMCFLGSEKYPGENEYKRYLSCHGGHSNGSTSMGYTTYKFDVLSEHAEKAIDIFSNFFISPLFTQSGTSREVNAVDSENSKNVIADNRRRLQILKALADPQHHYSKFSTGNAITLPAAAAAVEIKDESKDDFMDEKKEKESEASRVREALLTFHKRHYRPENMTVVCVGPQSLDTLEDWIVPRYAAVQDQWSQKSNSSEWTEMEELINNCAKDGPSYHHQSAPPAHHPAFSPSFQGGQWPVLLTTLPRRPLRNLYLFFPLPPVYYTPDQSPSGILSHLLGHEGPGSIFAVLQDASLLSRLSAGPRISDPDQMLLQIVIVLTEEGERRWKEVVQCVFTHCRLIQETVRKAKEEMEQQQQQQQQTSDRTSTPNLMYLKKMWKEIITLSSLHFNQVSPGSAYGLAPNLAVSTLMHGSEKCMSAGYMLDENEESFPLDDLLKFSSLLTPQNCFLERCSENAWKEAKAREKENKKMRDDIEEEDLKEKESLFGFKKERWYGVEYCLSEIDDADVSLFSTDINSDEMASKTKLGKLHLPKENLFIPDNLELCPDLPEEAHSPRIDKKIDPPNLVIEDENFGRLWHRLDDRYALPKSSLQFFFRNPCLCHQQNDENEWEYDLKQSLCSSMLMSVFSDALQQKTYDVQIAGLSWGFYNSLDGMTLTCNGYSDKLPELALSLLRDFFHPGEQSLLAESATDEEDYSFLKESLFHSYKDRLVRQLKQFNQSSRADTLAVTYTSLLMSHRYFGVKHSLEVAKSLTFDSLVQHHHDIIRNPEVKVDCLFSGNVSEKEAKNFFYTARDVIQEVSKKDGNIPRKEERIKQSWIPGPFTRRLNSGESIDLHFQSENEEEDNGAVYITFQSPIPGYKGPIKSIPESLRYSTAIRLISRMLREPLFDELRTKQQLGYIVQSSFSSSTSMKLQADYLEEGRDDLVAEIDSIVVNVLSKKYSPLEVASRIDSFLSEFRNALVSMPLSEIKDHSDSLRKQWLKPIRSLNAEVGDQFRKISRYGPELMDYSENRHDLPWNNKEDFARAVMTLTREDLLEVWDRVIAGKYRSRVVAHVYGKKFSLNNAELLKLQKQAKREQRVVMTNLEQIFEKRKGLLAFKNSNPKLEEKLIFNKILQRIQSTSTNKKVAAALLGVGAVGIGLQMMKKKARK